MTDIVRQEFEFFTVEAKKSTHFVDFTIYKGIGYLESFEEQVKLGIDPELGPNYNQEPLMRGYIKWDGCSNWDFLIKPGTSHPVHFCSREEAKCFGNMFPQFYDWAAELMPENKEELI